MGRKAIKTELSDIQKLNNDFSQVLHKLVDRIKEQSITVINKADKHEKERGKKS